MYTQIADTLEVRVMACVYDTWSSLSDVARFCCFREFCQRRLEAGADT